jgi:hypothetical protein
LVSLTYWLCFAVFFVCLLIFCGYFSHFPFFFFNVLC